MIDEEDDKPLLTSLTPTEFEEGLTSLVAKGMVEVVTMEDGQIGLKLTDLGYVHVLKQQNKLN